MEVQFFDIEGLALLQSKKFEDERGYFFESFNQKQFNAAIGKEILFVQDNVSISKKNVIRGIHLQLPPSAQGKLVRVIRGKALDVAVDIRKNSPTYGKHVSIELSEENGRFFWIPEGFAHGFCALEENTIFTYKCTNFYDPKAEIGIRFDDPDLGIIWPTNQPIVNKKDCDNLLFHNFASPF